MPRSLKKYMLMYSAVLLVPLGILTFFCYTYLISQFQAITYENEKAVYRNAVVQMEYRFSQMRDLALQLSNSSDILSYHLSSDLQSQINIMEKIRYSLSVSDTIQDLLLLDSSGNIYTSNGIYHIDTYQNLYALPLDVLLEEVNSNVISNFGIRSASVTRADDAYYFVTSYPYGSAYSGGALVFRVDKEQFLSSLQAPCLIFYDEQLIAVNQLESAPVADYFASGTLDGFNVNLESGRVHVTASLDEDAFFASFYQVRTQFMLLEAILAVLSVLLIILFSYHSYRPMKKLKTVMGRLGLADAQQEEIAASIATMERLSVQNQEITARLVSEKYIVREMWLLKLINHQYRRPGATGILENLKEYGVALEDKCYAVCLFQCGRILPKEVYPDMDGQDSPVQWYFFHDASYRLGAIAAGDSLAKILLERNIHSIMEQFALQEIPVECYVGSVCSRIDEINLSYIQALSLIRYEEIHNRKTHFFSDMPRTSAASSYPQDELNRLLPALQSRDLDSVNTLFSVLSARIASDTLDFPFAKTIAYAVMNTMINALSLDDKKLSEQMHQYLFWLDRAACKDDVLSLLEQMRNDWCSVYPEQKRLPSTDKMEKAIRLIDSRYTDQSFYVGQAAEACEMSVNNFSQQFKHKFGVSPVKYLASLRIEEAKRLLIETHLPVNEVASLCGFSDISSFQRNFKSNVSVTPTQYRSAHHSNEKRSQGDSSSK